MTLGDILAKVGIGGGAPGLVQGAAQTIGNDRQKYLDYAETCMVKGAAPLAFKVWQESGRPASCEAPSPAPGP